MLDEKARALLWDKEAQRAFTERGEALPCHCGMTVAPRIAEFSGSQTVYASLECLCGVSIANAGDNRIDAVTRLLQDWNTRAPILNQEQIKKLDG